MKEDALADKSYLFAIRMVKLYKFLSTTQKEFVLSKQVLRSGTSIGASIREAEFAQSKLDFIHKLSISLKETNETIYWLSLLKDTDFIDEKSYNSIAKDGKELLRLLIKSINTAKKNL
ncbi:MAG: four helix bundle protein [Bacteroidetes bacterium]|nr:four helix bundle protein [Bacteroidota bacterium]